MKFKYFKILPTYKYRYVYVLTAVNSFSCFEYTNHLIIKSPSAQPYSQIDITIYWWILLKYRRFRSFDHRKKEQFSAKKHLLAFFFYISWNYMNYLWTNINFNRTVTNITCLIKRCYAVFVRPAL